MPINMTTDGKGEKTHDYSYRWKKAAVVCDT
jgi:hypothetical protein